MEKILLRNNITDYDDLLFENINKHFLKSETIEKYKNYLFDSEFYGSNNLSKEAQEKLLTNPNIFLIANEIIDEIISHLIHKIQQSYEVNEIYRDQETDLMKFEKEEEMKSERRAKMQKTFEQLQAKHGEFDLLYDDVITSPNEMKRDINKFQKEFKEDLQSEYEIKFKKIYKTIEGTESEKKLSKYDTPEEVEAFKKKFYLKRKLYDQIHKEITIEKEGKLYELEQEKKSRENVDKKKEEKKRRSENKNS